MVWPYVRSALPAGPTAQSWTLAAPLFSPQLPSSSYGPTVAILLSGPDDEAAWFRISVCTSPVRLDSLTSAAPSELSATSLPLREPAIRFACLPVGGLWPETVSGPIWLFEVTT